MALPDGSFIFLNDSSHSSAFGELHAIEGNDGTVKAEVSEGK